jgi:hypothetical protein
MDHRSERRSRVSRPPLPQITPRIQGVRQPIGTLVAQMLRGQPWEAGLAELLHRARGNSKVLETIDSESR